MVTDEHLARQSGRTGPSWWFWAATAVCVVGVGGLSYVKYRHVDAARPRVPTGPGGNQQQGGPHALAARAEHVITEHADQLTRRAELLAHGALDQLQGLLDAGQGLGEAGGEEAGV